MGWDLAPINEQNYIDIDQNQRECDEISQRGYEGTGRASANKVLVETGKGTSTGTSTVETSGSAKPMARPKLVARPKRVARTTSG
jgi:hypothetical protein